MIRNALTFSSDLIVRDTGTLSSLCVFFDKIYLPYLPDAEAGLLLRVFDCDSDPDVDLVDIPSFGEFHHEWDANFSQLFTDGLIERLPSLTSDMDINDDDVRSVIDELTPNVSFMSRRLYYLSRVIHHLRDDHVAPHLIDQATDEPTRNGYKWLMANEAFSYLIPCLNELTPEQILEVRDKVADTREGFAMHLQKLSRDVERRVATGDPVETIQQYARTVIETELIPDFSEFQRQLSAERAGFWGKLLNLAENAMKLLVPATRIELAGSGFTTLSAIMAATADERRRRNSNVSQAFQFLSKLQSETVPERGQLTKP